MDVAVIGGIVRHILTALGGTLVAKGVLDAGQLEAGVGALAVLAGIGWSIWSKKKA